MMSASTSSSPRRFSLIFFNQVGKAIVIDVPLTVGGGIEIQAVDDAMQERVLPWDFPHVGGPALADLVGKFADQRPNRLLGIGGLQREEEADELVIALGELERFFLDPTSAA